MTQKIFAWPPVRVLPHAWDIETLTARSVGLNTGRAYVSSMDRARWIASPSVMALGGDSDGQGYCMALTRLLAGVHWVRLPCPPANWWMHDSSNKTGGGFYSAPVAHGAGVEFSGRGLAGVAATVSGTPVLDIDGLTPGELVARAWDVVRVYSTAGVSQGAARAIKTVRADDDGLARVPLFDPLPSGQVSIGDSESAVFEVLQYPTPAPALASNWTLDWRMRQVLPDEIPATAQEIDPWA